MGLGSSQTTSLNDQKNKYSSFSSSPYSSGQAKPAWQPKKSSWTHQPPSAAVSSQPTSMVGDIFGKSWSSAAPSSGIAIVEKNLNLFGDLVNFTLEQNKSTFFLSKSCRRRNGRRPLEAPLFSAATALTGTRLRSLEDEKVVAAAMVTDGAGGGGGDRRELGRL